MIIFFISLFLLVCLIVLWFWLGWKLVSEIDEED